MLRRNFQLSCLKKGIFYLVFWTPKKSYVFSCFHPNFYPGGGVVESNNEIACFQGYFRKSTYLLFMHHKHTWDQKPLPLERQSSCLLCEREMGNGKWEHNKAQYTGRTNKW